MAHRYESIRELDEEKNGGKGQIEMSIEKYMEQQPFRKLGPWGEEEIEETTIGYVCNEREACLSKMGKRPHKSLIEKYGNEERCSGQYPKNLANRSNRIRVKNIKTGVLFEFTQMVNAARFLGATYKNMTFGIIDKEACTYIVGEDKFVFEYDGVERSISGCALKRVFGGGFAMKKEVFENGFVEVVWGSGDRERFDSYLSVAIHLGLLIGHIIEEEDRWRKEELAKTYTIGKECCTLEFNGERRQRDYGKGIVSHWKGLYVEDWKKVRKVVITQGNPQN